MQLDRTPNNARHSKLAPLAAEHHQYILRVFLEYCFSFHNYPFTEALSLEINLGHNSNIDLI